MIRKLLIANRGEIAVRIIRAAHSAGIATAQVVSEADKDMLAARLAGEVVVIGPAKASRSYLNGAALIDAAKASGADAIHPGYGFLSENSAFAASVVDAGLIFVGPTAETIALMGDKAKAREAARAAKVPVVPGSEGRLEHVADAVRVAAEIGYPVMLKAAAGGGGRGIRVANDEGELRELFDAARMEAQSAFDDGGLYVEKFIRRARHIEVQILGDGSDVVHLFERECSVQRRRQKVWEEAPSAVLRAQVRSALYGAAVRLAEAVKYSGAGTIEFLYDDESESFFFIEMNTRIQVEHPVTEMLTGIDIVREMLSIAAGKPLSIRQPDVTARGHAIECRINAEDPRNRFLPSIGRIAEMTIPGGPGVRFDAGIYAGYQVPPFYDSLLGKLVVLGDDRASALSKLAQALNELHVGGIATTADLHRKLVRDDDIAAARVHTGWLEDRLREWPDHAASSRAT